MYTQKTSSLQKKQQNIRLNVTNSQHHLTTHAIKIVRIKTKRRNKMYNDNCDDNNDNDNNNNKNKFDLSLPNVKSGH